MPLGYTEWTLEFNTYCVGLKNAGHFSEWNTTMNKPKGLSSQTIPPGTLPLTFFNIHYKPLKTLGLLTDDGTLDQDVLKIVHTALLHPHEQKVYKNKAYQKYIKNTVIKGCHQEEELFYSTVTTELSKNI